MLPWASSATMKPAAMAYRRLEAAAFCLSPDQIDEVNALRDDHWERRRAGGASIWVNEAPLRPNPKMTDEYLIG